MLEHSLFAWDATNSSFLLYAVNPFLILCIAAFAFLYCERRFLSQKPPKQRREVDDESTVGSSASFGSSPIQTGRAVATLVAILGVVGLFLLEEYFIEGCPVDPVSNVSAHQIAYATIVTLAKMSVNYVTSFETLAAVHSGLKLPASNLVSDFLVEKPEDVSAFAATLKNELKSVGRYKVKVDSRRDLVQVLKDNGHANLWLFSKMKDTFPQDLNEKADNNHANELFFWKSSDNSIAGGLLESWQIFPGDDMDWNGIAVKVPRNVRYLLTKQFGTGVKMTHTGKGVMPIAGANRFQCLESIVRNRISGGRILVYSMFSALSIWLLARQTLISDKKKKQNLAEWLTHAAMGTRFGQLLCSALTCGGCLYYLACSKQKTVEEQSAVSDGNMDAANGKDAIIDTQRIALLDDFDDDLSSDEALSASAPRRHRTVATSTGVTIRTVGKSQ